MVPARQLRARVILGARIIATWKAKSGCENYSAKPLEAYWLWVGKFQGFPIAPHGPTPVLSRRTFKKLANSAHRRPGFGFNPLPIRSGGSPLVSAFKTLNYRT